MEVRTVEAFGRKGTIEDGCIIINQGHGPLMQRDRAEDKSGKIP